MPKRRPLSPYDQRVYRPLVAVMLMAWAVGVVLMVVAWVREF